MAKTLEDEIDAPEPGDDWDEAEVDATEELDEIEDPDDLEIVDDAELIDDDEDADDVDVIEIDGDTEALEQLEAEELEMLTEDEEAERLPVDEAEELREIRLAAISLEAAADSAAKGEFVCGNCFLVKARTQLADKRKKLCRDCA